MVFSIKEEDWLMFLFFKVLSVNNIAVPSKSENKLKLSLAAAFRSWAFPKSQEVKGKL